MKLQGWRDVEGKMNHAIEPTKGKECLVAIWSEGKECKKCLVDCYRKGWGKRSVDADNARLVAIHQGRTK